MFYLLTPEARGDAPWTDTPGPGILSLLHATLWAPSALGPFVRLRGTDDRRWLVVRSGDGPVPAGRPRRRALGARP